MDLVALYPPIAAATIISAIAFMLVWQSGQIERKGANATWWAQATIVGYISLTALLCYPLLKRPAHSYLDVFGAALAGQLVAALLLYGGSYAVFRSRGEPLRQRALAAFFVTVFLLIILGSAFVSPKPYP